MNTLAERIKELRKEFGINQEDLKTILINYVGDISIGVIKGWEQGKTKTIRSKYSISLANHFKINREWIETGKGEMRINKNYELSGDNSSFVKDAFSDRSSMPEIKDTDFVPITVYNDIYASAGTGNGITATNSNITYFDKKFLRDFFNVINFDSLDMIKVIGDSMHPTIQDGELIIIERKTAPKNGDTVIAMIENELYVKKFQKIPYKNWIILESENENYPPIELDNEHKIKDLNILGVVRSKIKIY